MKDGFGRQIDYMRLSVTGNCNLSCEYCSPDKSKGRCGVLSSEDIVFIASCAADIGINRFKITGGEPLLRNDVFSIINKIKSIPSVREVTLTTNGVFLSGCISKIKESGVDRINISVDTCDRKEYERLTGSDFLGIVTEGIEACIKNGIPIRINTVNRGELTDAVSMVRFALRYNTDIRFIELMPIGRARDLKSSSNLTVLKALEKEFGQAVENKASGNGPARYYSFPGLAVNVGFISAMGKAFCSECNRIRVTSDGRVKPCLCFSDSMDLTKALKLKGEDREIEVKGILRDAIMSKPLKHAFEDVDNVTETSGMDMIGG